MIATGIGMNAIRAGYRVLFANAKDLVDRLYEKMREGVLRETLEELNRIPLLIIDELSYLKMDRERESLFFQVIRHRYEKNSLIITTNLPMADGTSCLLANLRPQRSWTAWCITAISLV